MIRKYMTHGLGITVGKLFKLHVLCLGILLMHSMNGPIAFLMAVGGGGEVVRSLNQC